MGLLKRVFGARKEATETRGVLQAPPKPEMRVAVIGDIHGCHGLLRKLLERLNDAEPEVIVTVGDYVDRGEDSAQVLSTLKARSEDTSGKFICLMGNHEKMLLDFLDRPTERGARWLRNGGLQTLASFGVGGVTETAPEDRLLTARDDFRKALPAGMENWLRGLSTYWSSGTLWVVHGAADPAQPIATQDARTLLWGHRDFLTTPRQDGLWVAHGHTVVDQPQFQMSRIATDTGAYYSGRLTAAMIDPDGDVRFVQVDQRNR